MSATTICHCGTCSQLKIPGTDEPRYPVDRRTWLKHNQREMRQSRNITPTPLPSARQQVMDRKLSIIGAIQDRISDSHRKLDRLSSKMSARPSATQIAQLLQRLKTLRAGGVQLETDLHLAKKRTRQLVTVQTLHAETHEDLKTFTTALTRLEKRLHQFQQKALDERLRGKVILHISTPVRRSIQIQSIAKLSTYRSSLHQQLQRLGPILQLWMFMAVVCNVSAGLSHRACRFLLQMTHYIVQTCLIALSEYEHLPAIFKNMLEKDWPKDIRSAVRRSKLKRGKPFTPSVRAKPAIPHMGLSN
ncbi:hypothetical protein IMY05_C4174000400 [Salix suchowensis]|nr:hypothetical protein IMY05_C4174000400 [Salix suchowensis]